jgi:hypothetical protein
VPPHLSCCNIAIALIDLSPLVSGSKRVIAWLQKLPAHGRGQRRILHIVEGL